MKYIELKENLKDFIIFTSQDIKKIESNFDLRRLYEWQQKNYIKKVKRGYYIFSDLKINEKTLYFIANKIYKPSYISLESALSYYNLIPESVYTIISASSGKTNNFSNNIGQFSYRQLKSVLMFGEELIKYKNQNIKMASSEKALLDYFYLNPHLKNENDFYEMRFNKETFQEKVNIEKLNNYLKYFKNKNLEKRIKKLLKFIKNA